METSNRIWRSSHGELPDDLRWTVFLGTVNNQSTEIQCKLARDGCITLCRSESKCYITSHALADCRARARRGGALRKGEELDKHGSKTVAGLKVDRYFALTVE
jgi:hypothetical protein